MIPETGAFGEETYLRRGGLDREKTGKGRPREGVSSIEAHLLAPSLPYEICELVVGAVLPQDALHRLVVVHVDVLLILTHTEERWNGIDLEPRSSNPGGNNTRYTGQMSLSKRTLCFQVG